MHEFVVLIDGVLKTFSKYEDIPEKIDNVIKFLPCIPEPPHEKHQHDEMEQWNIKLKELLTREKNASNN